MDLPGLELTVVKTRGCGLLKPGAKWIYWGKTVFAEPGGHLCAHALHGLHPLVQNLRNFLSEMGGAFAFIGNQHRLEVGGQEYFIDLLLFHRRLRCLVAIELKIGEFKPEHKGKMEFYLEALDRQERMAGENSPIGIIICRSKNKTVVEYALRDYRMDVGVPTTAPILPCVQPSWFIIHSILIVAQS
jgi:hypothetical protein